jgi:uncharacterized protein (TIGR03435 family)
MLASLKRFLCTTVLLAGTVFGQAVQKPLEFEVASIRLSDPGASQDGYSLITNRGTGLTVKNGSVKTLIAFACSVREIQVSSGPGWVTTDHYDITAKADQSVGTPPDLQLMTDAERKTRDDRIREMLHSLLATRFGLATHNEMRDQNAYDLIVAKNGSKLTVAVLGKRQGINGNGRGRMQGFAASTAALASVLSNILGRPVLDKTALRRCKLISFTTCLYGWEESCSSILRGNCRAAGGSVRTLHP